LALFWATELAESLISSSLARIGASARFALASVV